MPWWAWLLGFVWSLLMWLRLLSARRAARSGVVPGEMREMGGRGGF